MGKEQFIIQKINSGDPNAFKLFFEEMYSSLCRFATKYLLDEEQSEDIVQDAFIKFWKKRKDIGTLDYAKSYLYATVKNSSLNYLRHQKHKLKFAQKNYDYELFTRDFIIEEEVHSTIHKAIDLLPLRSQNVIKLVLEGLKNPEIAEQMGISVNTVKSLKQAAYKKLRDILKGNVFILFLSNRLMIK